MFSWKNKDLSDFDKMKALRNTGSYAVLLLALGAMTFFGVCDPQSGSVRLSGAAATVAGQKVDGMEFRRYYNYYLRTLSSSQENFDPAQFGLANQLLDMFINNRISYIMAEKNGFTVSDSQIHEAMLQNPQFEDKDGKFSSEAFENFLKMNGYSEATYLEEQRRAMSVQNMEAAVGTTFYVPKQDAKWDYLLAETKYNVDYVKVQASAISVPVSDKEVATYLTSEKGKKAVGDFYKTNKADYESKAERKARHILVSYKGARNASGDALKRDKEAAKKRAEDLLANLKKNKSDFVKTAKENTDEPSGKKSGGDLGWFDKTKMVKEFADAAFALKKGEMSGVIESPFGFHIIKVEDSKAAKTTTLEQAQNKIAATLLENEKRPKYVGQVAEALKKSMGTTASLEAALKKDKLKWETTGEFAANANYLPGLGGDQRIKDAVFSLKKSGDTFKDLIKVSDNYFLVKLKELKKPDIGKIDADKMEELQNFSGMRISRQIYTGMKESRQKKLKDNNRIWKNPEYLKLDSQRNNS
ncbi:peptidylprolyl isomerase [Oligoflexaceae bacterium]|nr:peptidylprolyl isomerase [Oligoflexaceae bacterium]